MPANILGLYIILGFGVIVVISAIWIRRNLDSGIAPAVDLSVHPGSAQPPGTCACCDNLVHSVSGRISSQGLPYSVYHVQWTATQPAHGILLCLSLGNWTEDGMHFDRECIVFKAVPARDQSLELNWTDARQSPWSGQSDPLGEMLTVKKASRHPEREHFLTAARAACREDDRIRRFLDECGVNQPRI